MQLCNGRAEALSPDGYDGRALAEDFRALVTALDFGGGRPITLVAHDMGAPAALLTTQKVSVPVVAVVGALSKGDTVRAMLTSAADDVTGIVVPDCAHFVPEERPDVLYDLIDRRHTASHVPARG